MNLVPPTPAPVVPPKAIRARFSLQLMFVWLTLICVAVAYFYVGDRIPMVKSDSLYKIQIGQQSIQLSQHHVAGNVHEVRCEVRRDQSLEATHTFSVTQPVKLQGTETNDSGLVITLTPEASGGSTLKVLVELQPTRIICPYTPAAAVGRSSGSQP